MNDAPPVTARGLVKRYGDILAVAGVDLTVESGDVFGYLGPNGAGKTTSLRMMLGLIRPTGGSVELFGHDPVVDGAKTGGMTAALPTVVLNGVTAHELATQLGTVLEWQQGGRSFVLAGSLPPAAAESAARELK